MNEIEEIAREGTIDRHIHVLTISFRGQRVELTYADGKVQAATLVRGDGKYEIIGESGRDILARVVSEKLDATVFY